MSNSAALLELTSEIVSAFVSRNAVPRANIPELIASVSTSIAKLENPREQAAPALVPAVNPKRSVTSSHIVCLEDGKKFKSLKRHLASRHGLSPAEYRAKWGLAPSYPMVAPNYSEARSALATSIGLGRKPSRSKAKAAKPARAPAKSARPKRQARK